MIENEDVKLTKQWIERFVIGLGLCPFAHFSYYNNTIYYSLSDSQDAGGCLYDLLELIHYMKSKEEKELSNAFLIFDRSLSFNFMLQLKDRLDSKLSNGKMDGIFQAVVFHPEFQFGDEDYHSSSNFTNRSPLPMMHILREEEVARVISMTKGVDEIPFRNKEVLEKLEIKNISEVFEDDFMDKTKPYI